MGLHKIGKPILCTVNKATEYFLGSLEKLILFGMQMNKESFPVFIIGSPRSGTTLLYQLLVQRFTFAYFTNFAAKFYSAPILGIWLSKLLEKIFSDEMKFTSIHGRTRSLQGPHEAGAFWYRWFPKGKHVYVPPGATSEKKLRQLRLEVNGLFSAFNAPVLFKNTYNSMRIAPILEAFPNARFLICHRNPVDVAQSILKGRVDALGTKEGWWSLPPQEIDLIKKHPYWEQVVEQVYYIYRQIEEDRHRFGKDHFYNVDYEDLCSAPHGTLENIKEFLEGQGIRLKSCNDVPNSFPVSTGKKVSDEDHIRIVQKVNELWG